MTEVGVSSQEANCTLLVGSGRATALTSKDIKEALEKGDTAARTEALEGLIRLHVNGESQNHMIMTVIKYITPLEDHTIKRLLLFFWELIDKTDRDGNLLSVIILICSFLRNDLQHPNEYVRGLTLRFLCKVREKELVEPLVSAVVQNLTHRVTYVRRNAVAAVHAIYKRFPALLPDAPELVETFINEENDVSARRAAFDMLAEFAPERAAVFLSNFRDSNNLAEAGGVFLMSVVDFCRQVIRSNPLDKAKYVPILFTVLQAKSAAVRYQCASTLLSLSSSPTAIRQATLTFVDILKTHSDNSVRLIVVEQLDRMRERFLTTLQDSLLDVLSVLQDGFFEIRLRVVALAVELISPKNVDIFVQSMKKELMRAQSESAAGDAANALEYKQTIIRAINTAVVRYPRAAVGVLPVMLDYVCDSSTSGVEVMTLIKEVLQIQPELRRTAMERLIELFPMLNNAAVVRSVLWIFGCNTQSAEETLQIFQLLKSAMQPLPLTAPEAALLAVDDAKDAGAGAPAMQATTTVREDGTYVTSYAAVTAAQPGAAATTAADETGLRAFITRGDYFLAAALASTFMKLTIELFSVNSTGCTPAAREAAQADAVAILQEIIRYGTHDKVNAIDEDSQEHIRLALAVVQQPTAHFLSDVLRECRQPPAVQDRLAVSGGGAPAGAAGGAAEADGAIGAVDAPLVFTQLSDGKDVVAEMEAADDTSGAVGRAPADQARAETFLKKVEETLPLSGFSDPVYCEASVSMQEFEVSVDWLLVNQTPQYLQGVTIELASLGGMKLCERPQAYALLPHAAIQVRTALKVSATEGGVIYGSVLYDTPSGERGFVILNDIHVDIMNYIRPAQCLPGEFRAKWGAFDWENKITVQTTRQVLRDYVEFVVRELNMRLLEPFPEVNEAELQSVPTTGVEEEDCEYVSCNLYARTVFGEDALANVSVERDGQGVISGVVRIRSNTQTIAFGIGEKLNLLQKSGRC